MVMMCCNNREDLTMQFKTHSFRYGEGIFSTQPDFRNEWSEIKEVLYSISDDELIDHFNNNTGLQRKVFMIQSMICPLVIIGLEAPLSFYISNNTKKVRYKPLTFL